MNNITYMPYKGFKNMKLWEEYNSEWQNQDDWIFYKRMNFEIYEKLIFIVNKKYNLFFEEKQDEEWEFFFELIILKNSNDLQNTFTYDLNRLIYKIFKIYWKDNAEEKVKYYLELLTNRFKDIL